MITRDNFPALLESLGFEKKHSTYSKTIGSSTLAADIDKEELLYPEPDGLVINERQTCNFSQPENFVVFECVHRLLEKGYKPEHIELEPKWKVGRGASGGRADILIKDNFVKPLLIIECKTFGPEFKKAWSKTQQDGDQLFSYAQQISETQFLCLYASSFEKKLQYKSHIIAHRDNEQYLADNLSLPSFSKAKDVKERFAVWRDTYQLDYTTQGIFEDSIQAYHIGKDKYALSDLHAITATNQQKKYHEFATILRQHNVSGRENAFDKLVNLFLCKLVDEIENPNDLKFYWKGVAYDTHFDLMDRLQQLYQSGMDKFLGEDITYINQLDVNNALRFIKQNPDATQRAVWNLFIQQKFFTNNDFSFIDVHNERLFYQNAEVLLKILQMWQDIRLTETKGHNQFLGDMFEGFLDQGVKQSEGQFFTPMPICRFILMSLPLEKMVQDMAAPPMAIDYACGAGHFLTELALQLQPLLEQHKPEAKLPEYHKSMVGIEKEYRLSKVAKVSTFMYGQQGIKICYGDGLINSHSAYPDIKDDHFDLLVANPPYSVKGFLETLQENERTAYSLSDTINDPETAGSIETFFIERAKQLLKSEGVAAIILPSSILSNGGSSYIRAREILLQYFDIIAIAEFGSGTFGKTGTNTVTLFLRRKLTQPDTAEHFKERVAEWFKGSAASTHRAEAYRDGYLIGMYTTHINVPKGDYFSLLRGEASGAWKQHQHFQPYHDAFEKSTELKNLKKKKTFKVLSKNDQQTEIAKHYLKYVREIEQDKLYFFCLASDQANPVLIIRSPSATKEIKQFLGYDWSSAKGDEGIKLIEDANGKHITALYDGPDHDHPMQFNRSNPEKLSHYIGANFADALSDIPENLSSVAKPSRLVEMLDFSRATFEKQFLISLTEKVVITSRWPLVPLSSVAEIQKGTSITEKKSTPGEYKVIAGGISYAYTHNQANRAKNTITVSASGANAGYVNFWDEEIFASDCSTVRGSTDEHTEYLFNIMKCRQSEIQSHAKGAAQPHVYPKDIAPMLIPQSDPVTRSRVVAEWRLIDSNTKDAETFIKQHSDQIDKLTQHFYALEFAREEIGKLLKTPPQYGLNKKMNEAGIGYKIFRMNEVILGRMVDNGSMKVSV
ncbi:N-6 DNA methylase [Endozoicomonas sp. 8E]|uniref:N-6 DNA methylase n=1 Tax=Endozoicomonas sp. 8E TaxID=3035692 RepID=UPI0029390946|nr:N-6 DNA methylase [Endozoicomonas sp. 8E]WOG29909.1 N-6 DNA methylase [Endozoicomonas sp. 8E]